MEEIKIVQKKLKIPETGIMDEFTQAAIRNFQTKRGIIATGLLDNPTKEALQLNDGNIDSDLMRSVPIKKYFLPKGEYFQGPTKKQYIFLHHTAGYNNPFAIVDMWAKDPIGPIGTQYLIGGLHPSNDDDTYDGEIVQCFNDENYAWHLTIGNTEMHRNSIGIELCNFGWLTKGGYRDLKTKKWIDKSTESFYTYTGLALSKYQVVDLGFEFRGYRYYHKYSDVQLNSLSFLIKDLGQRLGIDIYTGIHKRLKSGEHPSKVFDFWQDAKNGKIKGLLTHANVYQSGKWDLSPQPNVIDMILSL